jgi:hypothetical protein
MIDERLFFDEISKLSQLAFENLRGRQATVEIYSIALWTDPCAAKSAICVDTFDNSQIALAKLARFLENIKAKTSRPKALALLNRPLPARNTNPADFEFRNLGLVDNPSIQHFDKSADAWNLLESLLNSASKEVAKDATGFRLHPNAVIGTSGRNDWFQNIFPLATMLQDSH